MKTTYVEIYLKKNNYWYTKLVFLGKTFYLMTRKDKASPYNTLIYYCNLHNITIHSNKIGIKECTITQSHFTKSGNYYTYYDNSFGYQSISYEILQIFKAWSP